MTMTTVPLELVLHSSEATWNREQWTSCRMTATYEIIDGVLYMSTAPSPWHQWISRLAQRLLYADRRSWPRHHIQCAWSACSCQGATPCSPISGAPPRRSQPHLGATDRDDPVTDRNPLALQPQHDLVLKRQAYARAGVPEYWVLRPQERDILVHSEPDPTLGHFLRVLRIPAYGRARLLNPRTALGIGPASRTPRPQRSPSRAPRPPNPNSVIIQPHRESLGKGNGAR
jgi:Uma2 family endonuclease